MYPSPDQSAYWASSADDVLKDLGSARSGLSQTEAERRLRRDGENRIAANGSNGVLQLMLRQYASPLVLILIFAAFVSMLLNDWTDTAIILLIVLGSTILGFTQEYRASEAIKRLRDRLSLKAVVLRDGREQTVDAHTIVSGDVVALSAGKLIPADGLVLEARDFLISQAALTGESFPVEKLPGRTSATASLVQRTNAVFLGTSVRSGTARVLITRTGNKTEMAAVATGVSGKNVETDFERGVRKFGYLLTRVMMVIVLFVLTVNLLLHRPLIDSLLFAVALAVGLTPELLPAIVSVTLSAGARRMAGRGVLVRRLAAIENLGGIDILCTDKTGTLTKGAIELSAALDVKGYPSQDVFQYAALNARLETGIENPLDSAIVAKADDDGLKLGTVIKVDEIPYDFLRKRLTVVVDDDVPDGTQLMVTKGAFNSVIACCDRFRSADGTLGLDDEIRSRVDTFFKSRSAEGYRVLGLASKRLESKPHYTREDELDMTFEGLLLFFDPLKENIQTTIEDLAALGIATKIISGDNRYVAAHVGEAVGLNSARLMTGEQLNATRDEALWHLAEQTEIFAEIDPQQKERIVRALQKRGHAVAYMGDGINDAPALHVADVGVSVDQAVDVARESADIVLLERELGVLKDGIIDGRRTFTNTLKYVTITTSANFGNMISMALATLFVPFLPLLAKQILFINFLSDFPAIAISTDNVEPGATDSPQRWDILNIQTFMIVFGLISTVFDLLTFALLLTVFQATETVFQTTWFVVSLLTELAVVMVLRTRLPCWRSRPSPALLTATILVASLAITVPYLRVIAEPFGFTPLPPHLLVTSLVIVALYIAITEMAKRWYWSSKLAGQAGNR